MMTWPDTNLYTPLGSENRENFIDHNFMLRPPALPRNETSDCQSKYTVRSCPVPQNLPSEIVYTPYDVANYYLSVPIQSPPYYLEMNNRGSSVGIVLIHSIPVLQDAYFYVTVI